MSDNLSDYINVNEQCKDCFHFQICANVLKNQLYIREKMLHEENPKCEHRISVADVQEVKHGHWVHQEYWLYSSTNKPIKKLRNIFICSNCGLIEDKPYEYCHCGAKMDEGGR